MGGPKTIRAFRDLGALDRLELLVLLLMAGGGISLPASDELRFLLVRSDRAYPDGTVGLVYRPNTGEPQ